MASVTVETRVKVVDQRNNTTYYPSQDDVWRASSTSMTAVAQQHFAITADATVTIWDPTTDATETCSNFDILILIADGILDVELTINEGDATEELVSLRLTKDRPLILGADDAYYNHSASNAFGGTLDVIDKIRVDEPESSAKNLLMIMAT